MRINASILDAFNRVEYALKYVPKKHKQISLSNEDSKEAIQEAFNKCISFEIAEDEIYFVVEATEKEISTLIEDNERYLKSSLIFIKNSAERKEEYKESIYAYIEKYNLTVVKEFLER